MEGAEAFGRVSCLHQHRQRPSADTAYVPENPEYFLVAVAVDRDGYHLHVAAAVAAVHHFPETYSAPTENEFLFGFLV